MIVDCALYHHGIREVTAGTWADALATARAVLFGERYADAEALEALDEKSAPAALVQLSVGKQKGAARLGHETARA